MPLPSLFWSTGWEDVMLIPSAPDGGITVFSQAIRIDRPINMVVGVNFAESQPHGVRSREVGEFYGRDISDSTRIINIPSSRIHGFLKTDPDFQYHLDSGFLTPTENQFAPPFVGLQTQYGGHSDTGHGTTGVPDGKIELWFENGSTTYRLYHWQPLTFIGTPAEIVGAMLMYCGLDPDEEIDKDSFDDAYDMQFGQELMLYVRTIEGEKVADTMKRVMDHSHDFLTINMAGNIGMVRRHLSYQGSNEITHRDIIGSTKVSFPLDLIINTIHASHGQWCAYEVGGNNGYDPNLEWGVNSRFFHSYEDTDSVDLFGVRDMGTVEQEVSKGRVKLKVNTTNLPYTYRTDVKDSILELMAPIDSKRRAKITIKQDLRGVDFDSGYRVERLRLIGGDEVILDTRCVKKQIDFNNLEVTSTLIESFRFHQMPTIDSVAGWTMAFNVPTIGTATQNGADVDLVVDIPAHLEFFTYHYRIMVERWAYGQDHPFKITKTIDRLYPADGSWNSTSGDLALTLLALEFSGFEEGKIWIKFADDDTGDRINETSWIPFPVLNPQ